MLIRHTIQLFPSLSSNHYTRVFKNWKHSVKWKEPSGFDTGITIYNSVIKEKVKFMTQRPNVVSWYCCGPTVYDRAHIGNFCSFMRFDIIRRIMENFFGLNVVMMMNFTDIDDKIIARLIEESNVYKSLKSLTSLVERQFVADRDALNILPPTIVARVTDHIPEVVEFIQALIQAGIGYATPDGSVYFSVNKYPNYGKFMNAQEALSTPELKEYGQDFALWKASKTGEPSWESPWGKGRPGWHIECSTLASKYFGKSIDLHSGGVDLKFPHHENEEAQCCALYGLNQWVNYWIHTGHLYTKNNEKMSKSLYNTTSVKEFLSVHSANTLRMLCLMIPYGNDIDFRPESIENAVALNKRFSQFSFELESYLQSEGVVKGSLDEVKLFKAVTEAEKAVKNSLANNFDTSKAITELLQLVSITYNMFKSSENVASPGSLQALAAAKNLVEGTLLRLGFTSIEKESLKNSPTEDVLTASINFRNSIRTVALGIGKNDSQELLHRKKLLLEACDTLRDDLLKSGIELKDRGKITTWNHIVHPKKSLVNS